jgi:hypothetical protein
VLSKDTTKKVKGGWARWPTPIIPAMQVGQSI